VNALTNNQKAKKASPQTMNSIVVPAVNVNSADFLVDSFVSCVIRAADVMDAIAAVPSTLSAIVSSVSSSSQQVQEPKKMGASVVATSEEDNSNKNKEAAPVVIELLDDDEVEGTEEEDEVICLGTIRKTAAAPVVPAPASSRGRPREKAATAPRRRKRTVTAAPERPRKEKTAAQAPVRKEKTVALAPAAAAPEITLKTSKTAARAPKRPLKTAVAVDPERPLKEKTAVVKSARVAADPERKKAIAATAAPVRLPTKKTVVMTAPVPERSIKKTGAAAPVCLPKKKTVTAPAPERRSKNTTVTAPAPKKQKIAAAALEISSKKTKKTVSFGHVQVQEYSVTVGDHPECHGGYPICLDWAHAEPKEYDLDAREKAKAIKAAKEAKAAKAKEEEDGGYGETKKKRRPGKGRRLHTKERHVRIAKVAGISQKEVRKLEVERRRQNHEATHGPDLLRLAAPAKASKGKSLGGYHEV
jgi:hypothetical protein